MLVLERLGCGGVASGAGAVGLGIRIVPDADVDVPSRGFGFNEFGSFGELRLIDAGGPSYL